MAIAQTRTLLSLDEWAKILNINPLHFNGIVIDAPSDLVPNGPSLAPATFCGMPIFQFEWQSAQHMARESIARAIADAEAEIKQYAGFSPRADWAVDEVADYPQGAVMPLLGGVWKGGGATGSAIETQWGYVIRGGIETKTLIDADAPVSYSDPDGDGYSELATISVAVPSSMANTLTADEIAVYYPISDTTLPFETQGGDDSIEIRPISVAVSGGVATIKVRREQLVLYELLGGWPGEVSSIEGTDDANFLDTVDVYRHWSDPATQATFQWRNAASACGCGGPSCMSCSIAAQTGCLSVADAKLGLIVPAPGTFVAEDDTTSPWTPAYFQGGGWSLCRAPDRVRLWYKHGYRNMRLARPESTMDQDWARAVAYLAACKLDRPLCQCANLSPFIDWLNVDRAKSESSPGGQSSSYANTVKVLDCPFGTKRGELYAYEFVMRRNLAKDPR